MCKNADKPCPGCSKYKQPEAAWMFFTDEERQALEGPGKSRKPPRRHVSDRYPISDRR